MAWPGAGRRRINVHGSHRLAGTTYEALAGDRRTRTCVPSRLGTRIVVHTRQGNREIVAAYDLASGKQLWQDGVDAPYTMNQAALGHGPGPK